MISPTCVVYHHIGLEGPFESQLDITSSYDAFAAQIEWISKHYTPISLSQLLSKDIPRNAVLFTFDDGFRSVLNVVREFLAPKSIPSVFFLNPGLLEPSGVSLDSTLSWAVEQAGLPAVCDVLNLPLRMSVGTIIECDMVKLGADDSAAIRDTLIETFGPPDLSRRAPMIHPDDIQELQRNRVEIGNHTMSHVRCRSLKPEEMPREIGDAKSKLENLTGVPVRSFAVPYGHEKDLTPEVLDYLRATGHEAIFLVHALANWRRPAPDIWYRTSMRNETPAELPFKLKIKPNLLSIRRWMKNV